MNLKILYITLGILSTELLAAQNQTMEMSLEQVVKIARLESPDAQTARHSFRSAYWNYKYYRANYLPSLSLSSDPNLNRAINKITMGDGSVKFVEQNLLNTDLTLNLSQNIPKKCSSTLSRCFNTFASIKKTISSAMLVI